MRGMNSWTHICSLSERITAFNLLVDHLNLITKADTLCGPLYWVHRLGKWVCRVG